MQATLRIICAQCKRHLGVVHIDTADMPRDMQDKVNKVVLKHRPECPYYRDRG